MPWSRRFMRALCFRAGVTAVAVYQPHTVGGLKVLVGVTEGQKAQVRRRIRLDAVRVLRRDKDTVAGHDLPVLTVYVDAAAAADDVQDVVARVNVQRKGAATVHVDQVNAYLVAVLGHGRGAHAAAYARQHGAVLGVQGQPVPDVNVSQVLAGHEAAGRRFKD
jgi:hypothetical protein